MEELTVQKAIKRGKLVLNFPVVVFVFFGLCLTFYSILIIQNLWILPIGLIISLVLPCLWWGLIVTKWRIWAFGNCRNVHELKRQAIKNKLIWPDGSRYEKTEIRTRYQRSQLELINKKFEKEDLPELIEDDYSTPYETKIYQSKFMLIRDQLLGITVFLMGFYFMIVGHIFGYVLLGSSFIFINKSNKKSRIKEPYIIINSKGITTINASFTPWENVAYTKTSSRGFGKHTSWYLVIQFKQRNSAGKYAVNLDISELGVSVNKLEHLIALYNQRNRIESGLAY